MSSKIHRATITRADLNYVGSITIDADLMREAGLVEGEQVHVVDINNGARLITYVITGDPGTGEIGINGAAARLVHTSDLVIIIAYAQLTNEELATHRPKVVHVDGDNRIVAVNDMSDVLAVGS
jgi:aspartate 1-decarboxylase